MRQQQQAHRAPDRTPTSDAERDSRLRAALEWLGCAQDGTGCGGFARGYSRAHPRLGHAGWQTPTPATTGSIIPTLYLAARRLGRPDLAERAQRAAGWEVDIQLLAGGVRGGLVGRPTSLGVFETGQALLGWLSAFRETGSGVFAGAARRAGRFLVATCDLDGLWRRGASHAPDDHSVLYNLSSAWALAEAGQWLGAPELRAAAATGLRAVMRIQHDDGWMADHGPPDEPRRLADISDAIRGLLEGGRVLGDERLIGRAMLAAHAVASAVDEVGRIPSRFAAGWKPLPAAVCLTGQAQMVSVWLRLVEITGARAWLEPARSALRFLEAAQDRWSVDPGLRGGVLGRLQVLSCTTNSFADALLREAQIASGSEQAI